MPDEINSQSRARSGLGAAPARLPWMLLVFMRFAVDGGPRSSPGYNLRGRVVLCPTCGKKVRLEKDGWGYCRKCRREFDGRSAREA